MLQAKICGISTDETLDAAIANGASHIGLNFFPPSPRALSPERGEALAARTPRHVTTVAILVGPEDELLDRVHPIVDAIQVHGRLDPSRAAAIAARGKPVWQAIPVKTAADLAMTARFRGAAERVVYDAKTPDDAALPGGMGLRFDWRLLSGFAHPLPWTLSGGLDAGNVGEAVGITGALMVDVSSGVESEPGVKDVDKIAAFLQAVARL